MTLNPHRTLSKLRIYCELFRYFYIRESSKRLLEVMKDKAVTENINCINT